MGTHHDWEVGGHDVVVAARSLDGDGVGAQPRPGVWLAVVLLDPGRLEGGRPLDGPEPTGESGEAVEIVAGVVVAVGSLWTSAALVATVDVGDAVFLVILATSLALGGVALAVAIVDTLTQILLVELVAKVDLVDLSVVTVRSCRVVARLGAVGRVVLAQLLGLRGGHVQTSTSLDDLGGLLKTLENLEHCGEVGRWRREDILAVVVEAEVGIEVARLER